MLDRLPLLHKALAWLEAGERPWLIHVARTWGSSPRPVGSLMLLSPSGRHAGSVSGGCVEGDLFQRLERGELDPQHPSLIEYGGGSNPQVRLPCRTTLQLVVEPLQDRQSIQSAIHAIEQRHSLLRRLDLATGEVGYTEPRPGEADLVLDEQGLSELFGPQWRVLLIGANDLGHYVARQCMALGYEVFICDPREEYRQQWEEQDTQWVDGMPDEAAARLLVDDRAALLALTHDPRLDDMALMQALQGPAFYVGALGSRRSVERRQETLAQMGLSQAQIGRLDAPIGLDIGSRSPAEIKLIQVRNSRHQRQPLQARQAG